MGVAKNADCWVCGTGKWLCVLHQRMVAEAAKREGHAPLTREQLARGGRR